MALNEKSVTITANTSADEVVLIGNGEAEIGVDITAGTCTIAYHQWSEAFGRGSIIRTGTTADDPYFTKSRAIEIVVTSASGLTLEIFRRPVELS